MVKVYVSSTLGDLSDERRAVMDWLVAAGHQPVHSYRPDSDTVRDSCLDDVVGCDLLVLILGHRYGFQPEYDGLENLSITHLEFRRAGASGVPRIALIRTSVPDIRQSDLLNPQRAALVHAFEEEVRGEVRSAEFQDLHGLLHGLSTGVQAQLDKSRTRSRSETAGLRWLGPVVSVPPLTGLEVARPGMTADIVTLLTGQDFNSVERTMSGVGLATRVTGVTGAGGFGKTSLARLVAHDRRVRNHFSDGVVWVTVGQDVQGPLLAEKVNEVTARLTGERPPLTDPVAAGSVLGQVLAGRRLLLVVDDLWSSGQLQPFLQATQPSPPFENPTFSAEDRWAAGGLASGLGLLVTARGVTVLPQGCGLVTVDAMDESEAHELLTRGLLGVPAEVVSRVLRLTGQWPVLLSLVNGSARSDVRLGAQPGRSLIDLADQISADGPEVLDSTDQEGHEQAVSATLHASLKRLTADQQQRYAELAVFGEDVDIPRGVLERYWAYTNGRTVQTHQLCSKLLDLGLAAEYRLDGNNPRLRLHDVIRAWLRHRTQTPLEQLDQALVDSHRGSVSAEAGVAEGSTAWWRLSTRSDDPVAQYLWAWLPRHLASAGATAELTGLLQHAEWLLGQLVVGGPGVVEAHLLLSHNPVCEALVRVVRQDGHLLGRLNPPGSLAATLASRCDNSPELARIRSGLVESINGPHLEYVGQVPDLPHPRLHRILAGHSGWVGGLLVGGDGSWLAAAGEGGTVRVWDLASGVERHTLTGDTARITGLTAAPDGSWLGAAGVDGTVRVWDLASGVARHTLTGDTYEVTALLTARDGRWLAAAGDDGTVHIWDPISGTKRHTLTGHIGEVTALLADGNWLASAGWDGTVRVWDLFTGAERLTLTGHIGRVTGLTAAPGASWLASAGVDGTVRVWDLASGVEQHSLAGHIGEVTALLVARDGSWLSSGGKDGTVRVWDPASGVERHTLTGHTARITTLTAAPDGTWLASVAGLDGVVRVWDPVSGAERHTLTGHTDEITALRVAPDGTWLASASWDGVVRVWDLASGPVRHTLTGHTGRVTALLVARDGSWLASGGKDGTVRVWDPASGVERHILTGHTEEITALSAPQDGSWLASAGWDGVVRIWDPASGVERHTLTGKSLAVTRLLAAPDGSWLASAGWDGVVRVWHLFNGAERLTLAGHTRTGHVDEFAGLLVARDGSWLASAGKDGTVLVWDPASGAKRNTFTGHSGEITAVLAAPDGAWLASAGKDGTVRLWNLAWGAEWHTLTGHTGNVGDLVVAPDGRWLASAGEDGTVRVWDPAAGVERHTLAGHTGKVTGLVVAPDGRWLASGGEDGTMRVWDPVTGDPSAALRTTATLTSISWTRFGIAARGAQFVYMLQMRPASYTTMGVSTATCES